MGYVASAAELFAAVADRSAGPRIDAPIDGEPIDELRLDSESIHFVS